MFISSSPKTLTFRWLDAFFLFLLFEVVPYEGPRTLAGFVEFFEAREKATDNVSYTI